MVSSGPGGFNELFPLGVLFPSPFIPILDSPTIPEMASFIQLSNRGPNWPQDATKTPNWRATPAPLRNAVGAQAVRSARRTDGVRLSGASGSVEATEALAGFKSQ